MTLAPDGPVVIIGAGPAGSLLAILLARRGEDVVIYESRSDMRRVDISAGRSINLALATRGIAALDVAGVMDRVDPITIPMRGRMVHSGHEVALQPYGAHDHEVIHSVSRRDLNAILLDAAEATGRVRIEFDQRCRSVDFDAKQIHLTDGANGDAARTEPFGVVFGADGSGSVVRGDVLSRNGGVVDIAPLGHGYKEMEIASGPDGSFKLDPNALHIWPRGELMLIALANPEGDFTVTLFAPNTATDDGSLDSLADPSSVEQFFKREFPDFVPLVPDLVEQFFANPTGLLATVRTKGWALGGEGVLVGDAAHGVVPFHGQGMNAAMESCLVLDRCIGEHPGDLAAAFEAFEVERRPDTDAIAQMALDNYIEMRAGVVDPDYQMRRALELELQQRWPDYISPRYSMVMFSVMGYADAKRRAKLQQELMGELLTGVSSVADVDYERARQLVTALDPLSDPVGPGGGV